MPEIKPDFIAMAKKVGVQCVYDCGSRDALNGLELARQLNAEELHVFECNPQAIELCRKTIGEYRGATRVYLNPCAIAEKEQELDFYPIDPKETVTSWKDGNIGASSLYKANPAYPYERYVQTRITVNAVSLNTYCQAHSLPDLLWLDVQGAELRALQGASDILSRVKVAHVGVSFRELYLGQPLFWEVDGHLGSQFKLWKLYDIKHPRLLRLATLMHREKWFTDAVYVNKDVYDLIV